MDAIAFEPCRIKGYAHALECQTIQIDQFNIKVYRMASVVRYPLAEPIVWIPGGLGVDVNRAAAGKIRALRRIRTHQDLIWLEILDTNLQPWLRCAPNTSQTANIKPVVERIDHFADPSLLQQCYAQVSHWGISAFSADKVAKLYESMRQALGYDQVVVFADGNGAKIALAWQKQARHAIQFQVFDNPPSLTNPLLQTAVQTQARFEAYRNACQQVDSCSNAYGDAAQHLQSVVDRLPQDVMFKNPLTGQSEVLALTETAFYLAMNRLLQSSLTASQVPKMLSQIDRGEWQLFVGLLALSWSKRGYQFNDAAYLAQYCLTHGVGVVNQPDNKSWFYRMGQQRFKALCEPFALPSKPEDAVLVSEVPTLVLKSGLPLSATSDWLFLTHRTSVHAPNATGSLLGYGCAKDVVYRYFKWQRQHSDQPVMDAGALNASCVESIPLPRMEVLQ